jgi:hypothetical protein
MTRKIVGSIPALTTKTHLVAINEVSQKLAIIATRHSQIVWLK